MRSGGSSRRHGARSRSRRPAVRERPTGSQERLEQAERLLFDRQCAGGGWNYGNSEVLGQKLHAYVPTTALALLALQDRRDPAGGATICRVPARASGRMSPRGWRSVSRSTAFASTRLPTAEVEAALATAWQKSAFLGNHSRDRHGAMCADGWDAWTTRLCALNGGAATSWRCRSWRRWPRVVRATTVAALPSRLGPRWVSSPLLTTGRTSRT